MSKPQPPLGVTLVGMDERSEHALQLFFQGPCKNSCAVVEPELAEISIVDMDVVNADKLYAQQREQFPKHQFILIALVEQKGGDAFFVKKPMQPKVLMDVLSRARKGSEGKGVRAESIPEPVTTMPLASSQPTAIKKSKSQSVSNSTHQSAMSLDEKSFISFIGALKNIDTNSEEQINSAHYDPKAYLQGYFQSACKVALNKKQILQLNGSWKPLVIFPRTNEIWLDADDKQLQAACRMSLKTLGAVDPLSDTKGSGMTMSAVNDVSKINKCDRNNFQSIESFLWKVSLWTSQGRVPLGLDLERPVYLSHWPNMTRLMLSPHAVRIAALLVSEPRSLLEVAAVLNIPQQYVFAFYSAARALGLAGQVKREVDLIVTPSLIKKPKQRGLFGKILDRLKMG
jgi:hypothetical protein